MTLRLSYSQLKLFKTYPREYYYKYVLKLPEQGGETKWLDFGKAMHEVLEEYYSTEEIDYNKNMEAKWKKYKLEGRMDYNSFRSHVFNGIAYNILPTDIEQKFFLPVGPFHFVGYADIIDRKNGIILDWKSGTYTAAKAEDYKKQLQYYAYLYYRKYNELPTKCALFFNKSSKEVPCSFIMDEVLDVEKEIIEAGNEILRKKATCKTADSWGNEIGFFSGYHYVDKRDIMKYNIRIKGNNCFLEGPITPMLVEGIDRETRFDLPNKHWMQQAILKRGGRLSNPDEVGRVHLFDKSHRRFYLGHLNKIKKLLSQYCTHIHKQMELNIIDERDTEVMSYKTTMRDSLRTEKILRPYQVEAVEAFIHSDGIGFLEMATGSGKSLITAELIRMTATKTLWIIDRKELLHQSRKWFQEYLDVPIGIIGDNEEDIQEITVATIQSLVSKLDSLKGYLSTVNFVIVDEAHHVAASSYQRICSYLNNTKYRLGTTATATRQDGTEPVLFSLFGDIIYTKTSEELIELGYLIKPKACFYEIKSNGTGIDYMDDYKTSVSNNPFRNSKIIYLTNEYKDKKILILTKLVPHGAWLCEHIPGSVHIHGSTASDLRESYMENFKKSASGILIATVSIASEGLDIPDLDIIINASANKSDTTSVQVMGRVLRKIEGKTSALYIDFQDTGKFTKKHSNKRIQKLRSEGHEIIKL